METVWGKAERFLDVAGRMAHVEVGWGIAKLDGAWPGAVRLGGAVRALRDGNGMAGRYGA